MTRHFVLLFWRAISHYLHFGYIGVKLGARCLVVISFNRCSTWSIIGICSELYIPPLLVREHEVELEGGSESMIIFACQNYRVHLPPHLSYLLCPDSPNMVFFEKSKVLRSSRDDAWPSILSARGCQVASSSCSEFTWSSWLTWGTTVAAGLRDRENSLLVRSTESTPRLLWWFSAGQIVGFVDLTIKGRQASSWPLMMAATLGRIGHRTDHRQPQLKEHIHRRYSKSTKARWRHDATLGSRHSLMAKCDTTTMTMRQTIAGAKYRM